MAPLGEVSPGVDFSAHYAFARSVRCRRLRAFGRHVLCRLRTSESLEPNAPDGDPPPPQKSAPRRFRSRLATTRELALSFCCRREGESRRIDLVMIDPTDREVFHHNATAAVAEHLCEAALTNTGHLRVS